jgi:hypothetical protein
MRRLHLPYFSKLLAVCADAWSVFPIVLTMHLAVFPNMPFSEFAGALLGAYVFTMVLRILLIRRNKLLTVVLSLAACIGLGILLGKGITVSAAIALLSFTAACRSMIVAEQPFHIAFPRTYSFAALFIYFFAYILYGRIVGLKEYQGYIFTIGLIAIPFTLILINSDVLVQASRAELMGSSSMPIVRRNNRIITIITLLTAVIAASYNTLKDAFVNALQAAFLFLLGLIDRIMNYLYTPIQGGGAPGEQQMPQLPPAEAAPSSPFWDMVVLVAGYVIFFVLVIGFVILLGKALINLFRRLKELIKRLMANSSWSGETYGYSEEKENLIDWQSIRHNYAESVKEWLERVFQNEPKWGQLTDNRQRVRYLYRHLVLRSIASGYAFRASRTPVETIGDLTEHEKLEKSLQPALKNLYGEARYGNGTIKDSEVGTLKKSLKL